MNVFYPLKNYEHAQTSFIATLMNWYKLFLVRIQSFRGILNQRFKTWKNGLLSIFICQSSLHIFGARYFKLRSIAASRLLVRWSWFIYQIVFLILWIESRCKILDQCGKHYVLCFVKYIGNFKKIYWASCFLESFLYLYTIQCYWLLLFFHSDHHILMRGWRALFMKHYFFRRILDRRSIDDERRICWKSKVLRQNEFG